MIIHESRCQIAGRLESKDPAQKQPNPTPGRKPVIQDQPDLSLDLLQSTCGNLATLRLLNQHVQAKDAKLSHPSEPSEQQADRMAARVLSAPEPDLKAHLPDSSQLIRGAGRSHTVATEAGDDGYTRTQDPSSKPFEALQSINRPVVSLKSGANPLPPSVRGFFEPRFGRDLSDVRIHTGHSDSQTAEALNARAFTLGHHLFFGAHQWAPQTARGRHLIAHELSHVVQQAGPPSETRDRIFRAEEDREAGSLGSVLASATAAALISGFSGAMEALASEPVSDQSQYEQTYRLHLQIAIILLEEAASKARARGNSLFGRAVSGNCLPVSNTLLKYFAPFSKMTWLPIVTHAAFDARFWDFKVDCAAGEAKLFQKAGKPSEAIDEMFDNLGIWTFDCAEYLQVAQWYAQRHTMGAAAFNAKITNLGGLVLKPHGSTGIVANETYVRRAPGDTFYRESNITNQTEPSDKMEWELLDVAPIGTRVTFTNAAAPTESGTSRGWWAFGNENTLKMGDNQYAAHPMGTLSREEIECRLAARGHVQELKEAGKSSAMARIILLNQLIAECKAGRPRELIRKYIQEKIFISRIEFFKIY